MILVKLEGHSFKNEIHDVIRLFFRDEELVFTLESPDSFRGIFISSSLLEDKEGRRLVTSLKCGGFNRSVSSPINPAGPYDREGELKREIKMELKRHIYLLLSQYTGRTMPWGMLTGIRPAKLVHDMLERGLKREEILHYLKTYYMVSREKSNLVYGIAEIERCVLKRSTNDMIGLYIGIPFCPTRCLYCSFTSEPLKKYQKALDPYMEALKKEISSAGEAAREKKLKVQSIYIGGGTPTSLDAKRLGQLLEHIEANFDLENLEEYTLEGGRPDSIDRDKLAAIKASRVDRISINPQTMNNETLKLIGRQHTPEDTVQAFQMAREMGFGNINMDVIVGLPGESWGDFKRTLEEIERLQPESLTVHTMSVKRASRLNEEKDRYNMTAEYEVLKMIDLAENFTQRIGMHPYYLYRQKNILGNLENVGYCKPGLESIYNIQIMEEKQTIIALGAGAITKVVYPLENRHERAFNVKNVEEYINRIDEMIERKKALIYMI